MIINLRRKFVVVAMTSITIVMLILMISINVVNYNVLTNRVDSRMDLIESNNGKLPHQPPSSEKDIIDTEQPTEFSKPKENLSPEAAYDSRFFSVTLNSKGSIITIDTGNISAISTSQAKEYAKDVFEKSKRQGYKEIYRYRIVEKDNDTIQIFFLDCNRELNNFESNIRNTALISLLGLVLVFLLACIFSKMAVKPIIESYEKQKRFITDASHEIKTPLTIIDANTEVLELMDGENEWTISTRHQVARLTALTEKLVFLSRMDEYNSKPDFIDFNISNAIIDTAEGFSSVARSKGRSLEIDVSEDITYHGDEKTIRQMTSLLMDNALKYSTDNSTIKISFYLSGKNKILCITNSVNGMEPGNKDMLFERFYRADESRSSRTGGFGIGLSVVKAIAEMHKAKVSANSDGHSISFSVIL